MAIAAPTAAQDCRNVYIQKSCHKTIRIVVNSATGWHDWRNFGWYEVKRGVNTRLLSNDRPICHQPDHDFYFYAETKDRKTYWEGQDCTAGFGGATYPMRKATTSRHRGGSLIEITCNCRPAPGPGGLCAQSSSSP
jgi:hypothetical protein